ncbi:MAG: FAD-binding protein [Trebonia sp.]
MHQYGVVIDWSKYCHRVLEIDADAQTCTVESGIVLDVLNKESLTSRDRV